MSEVHKIQLPAVPADKESGKQIRSQIVASREVFRRMLELQRASFSGYYPDGEESMIPDGHPNSPTYGHLKLPHLN